MHSRREILPLEVRCANSVEYRLSPSWDRYWVYDLNGRASLFAVPRGGLHVIVAASETPMAENPETPIQSLLPLLTVVPEVPWYHLADPSSSVLDELAARS